MLFRRRSGDPFDGSESALSNDRLYVSHTGGAVGGTTVLLMSLPSAKQNPASTAITNAQSAALAPPISVAVLTNLEGAHGILKLAVSLAEIFTDYAVEVFQSDSQLSAILNRASG